MAAFETFLRLTLDRRASGVASQADVAQAETQLKTTQAQAIDVGVQRAQLEHAIALLMGQAPATFTLPAAPLAVTPPAIPIGVPSELLERRPDIAAAERRVAVANAQIGVAVAAFYPTITLNASSGLESSSLAKWFTAASHFWSVGPGISETVFDGGLRAAQTDAARAAYDATVASYRQTVLGAFQGVEDNLAALRILEQEGGVEDEAVKAAQDSVRLTTEQYRQGIVSYLNVVTAQTIALRADRDPDPRPTHGGGGAARAGPRRGLDRGPAAVPRRRDEAVNSTGRAVADSCGNAPPRRLRRALRLLRSGRQDDDTQPANGGRSPGWAGSSGCC